jgi:hypothetical protein
MVLAVVGGALIIAMFMNADATARKAAAPRGGEANYSWRQSIATGIASFSDFWRFTGPRERLDQALGKNTGPSDAERSEVEQLAAENAEEAQAVAEADLTPVLRAPTAEAPLKLWVGGDSVSADLGVSLEAIGAKSKLFTVRRDSRVSTGLSRPDFFDWPTHLARDVVPSEDPDVLVFMVGPNDSQNIPLDGGRRGYALGTPEWQQEYRLRVAGTMDALRSRDNDRLLLWVGTPQPGPGAGLKQQDTINWIVSEEAAKRPWVRYVDSWGLLNAPDGSFAARLPNADGQEYQMRQKDNIHLAIAGADRLAWSVWAVLGAQIDLSQSQVQPDPAQSAPADATERPSVPAPG